MRNNTYLLILLPLLLSITSSCQNQKAAADVVYSGGTILTMEDDVPQVEALAVKDGKIVFAGSKEKIKDFIGKQTVQVNLENKTLLPGFIDAHGHITSRSGMSQAVDFISHTIWDS